MGNEQPLVSVIIPCYNHERYIAQSIESVINQTYKNIQLIVIDDGSIDNSFEIITKLKLKYNFFAIKQKNRGLSATLNKGIKEFSKGKYIACLASDDYWALEKIEKQIKFFQQVHNLNYIMCCTKAYAVNNQGDQIEIGSINEVSFLKFEKLIISSPIKALTVMLKKEAFDEVGYFDESLRIEDWDMWLRISYKSNIGFINECLAYYRDHENNSTNKNGWIKLIEDKFKIIEKWKFTPYFPEALKILYLQKIEILNNIKEKKSAFALWISCWRYWKSFAYWKELIRILLR